MENPIKNLDLKLLKKQKEWLISQTSDESVGLLNMIDDIQDYLVHKNIATEQEVFGV